ncbi:MAG: tyrosine-type recombinase/integrase [Desulfobacteraceae bacterium]
MPARIKTNYPGVYGYETKYDLNYYIRYKKKDKSGQYKLIEEMVGKKNRDAMTPAKASKIRTKKIEGLEQTNQEQKEELQKKRWVLDELWQEYLKGLDVKTKNAKTDISRYQKYIQPLFGYKKPFEITQLEVDGLRIKLLKEKSPQTVKHVLGLLRRIVNFGVQKQLVQGLSFKIQMPVVRNEKTEYLSPDKLSDLVAAIEVEQDKALKLFFFIVLYTGARKGSVLKLKISDFDFHLDFILFRKPKSGKNLTVPLPLKIKKMVQDYLKTEHQGDSEFLFPGKNGGHRVSFSRGINRIAKRAGLPADFRPVHGLRHVFASNLASSGEVDMYTIQKLLGHSDPRMTQRYSHLRDESLRKASLLNEKILEEKKEEISQVIPFRNIGE